jgi:hypothetical protein
VEDWESENCPSFNLPIPPEEVAYSLRHYTLYRDELKAELEDFEQQYGIASSEFYLKFERGEMGDDLDFVDWSGAWRVYQAVQDSLTILEAEPTTS